MGNSESSLTPYRYNFANPVVGDLDLSKTKVYKIDDQRSSEAAESFLQDANVLYVDCEGHYFGNDEQKLGTVQVATGLDYCLVFHITKYRKSLDFLKTLFESDRVRKVFHDCSGDSAVLFHENKIQLRNVDDTQIAHKVIQSRVKRQPIDQRTGLSLADLYMHYCGERFPGNKSFNKNARTTARENLWISNPVLFDQMVKYAVIDVLALCKIFSIQERLFTRDSEYKQLINKQLMRKRKGTDFAQRRNRVENSESFNWGLFAAGAAVTVAAGVAVAASLSEEKKRNVSSQKATAQNKTEENKECIIS